jgi:hypothetical protein
MPDQYHYTQLQDAVQGRGESAGVFAYRCRKLCQKTVRRVKNAVAQVILNEEAERRLVAAYINGLRGLVRQQVKFRMPATMNEASRLAVTTENAEQQWPSDRRVFATALTDIACFRCNQKGHIAGDNNTRPFGRNGWAARRGRGRSPMTSRGWNRPTLLLPMPLVTSATSSDRNFRATQTREDR